MMNSLSVEMVFQVSDFVEYFNQTISYAYPQVVIEGEIANLKISKNRWVYFDLKDEFSSVKFFGSIYSLPGPMDNGMMVQAIGVPNLHNLYGFSINFKSVRPVGEGSIKKASDLLREKLKKEGLFEESRKKYITPVPQSIGLITSLESAAYQDFNKIVNNRWSGMDIQVFNVGVQGVNAVDQNIRAVNYFNSLKSGPELLVITRGGGSKDDLSVYDDERLVRVIAKSHIPTVVAVGHEVDVCLAELVADKRASTPSNAAELLTPDKKAVLNELKSQRLQLDNLLRSTIATKLDFISQIKNRFNEVILGSLSNAVAELHASRQLLYALNPEQVLKRGYSVVRYKGKAIGSVQGLAINNELAVDMADGQLQVTIDGILKNSK